MKVVETLSEAVETFHSPETTLFGVRFIPESVGQEIETGTEVNVSALGMFSLGEGLVSFRARISIKVSVLKELWIDVAVAYIAPDSYMISKDALLEFANKIALPQLHMFAQVLLDPLLIAAGYPPKIIPPPVAYEDPVFQGSKLPDLLDPAVMEQLREDPELSVPEPDLLEEELTD